MQSLSDMITEGSGKALELQENYARGRRPAPREMMNDWVRVARCSFLTGFHDRIFAHFPSCAYIPSVTDARLFLDIFPYLGSCRDTATREDAAPPLGYVEF